MADMASRTSPSGSDSEDLNELNARIAEEAAAATTAEARARRGGGTPSKSTTDTP